LRALAHEIAEHRKIEANRGRTKEAWAP